MAMLEAASVQDVRHLLELFPIAKLREVRPDVKGIDDPCGDRNRICAGPPIVAYAEYALERSRHA